MGSQSTVRVDGGKPIIVASGIPLWRTNVYIPSGHGSQRCAPPAVDLTNSLQEFVMKTVARMLIIAPSIALVASSIAAQSISIGLRGTGSIPTGSFAETQTGTGNTAVIEGAKNGFGYGLDLAIGLGPISAYGGFDHVKFDCETATCQSDGKYTMSGVAVGLKLAVPMASRFRPYIKGGVTFQDLAGGYGGSNANVLTTERTPGYEIGAGLDYQLLGILSLTPQVRYVGQNFKPKIPGVITPTNATEQSANYITFDLGLSLHTPFSGGEKKR